MESGMKNEISLKESNCQYSDEEKIRAAYALNMCMVSVSQIIDYDDLNILEQEYQTSPVMSSSCHLGYHLKFVTTNMM